MYEQYADLLSIIVWPFVLYLAVALACRTYKQVAQARLGQ